ncbi:MAG: response regulator transcription factor [Tannerellaceae bacterium]|jgi:DNA-binding NarL/FixJ family response regulator|nr:response regulator transcription factor [Tannerellaceae bacterium]
MIRIAIIDDHKAVVEGFEYLINLNDGMKVTGKAHSAAEGRQMLQADRHDVLLLDLSLPDANGIELCREIKSRHPALKIMMLTSYGDLSFIVRAMEQGASGYVIKNAEIEEVIEGIRTLAAGGQYICDEADALMKRRSPDNPVRLSRRETELLKHIADGHSNSEIADRMCLGYETIKSYRKNIMFKLQVHNTAELVRLAIEHKLI